MSTDLTVADKLRQLYELQLIDSEIDQINVLKGELPIEVQDLEDEIEGLNTRITRLSDQVDDLKGDISRHNGNIEESNALIERYKTQMDNVKNNREYDALTKEIQMQELDIKLAEKRIRESNVQLESKSETLGGAQERMGVKTSDLDAKKVELEKIIEKTVKEEEKLKRKRNRHTKQIESRLIGSYEKIRSSYRNGLAVATIARDACGGCFNKIPAQVQLEIGTRKKIIACEHCGRVLVDDQIMEAEVA
ncbi:MAG: hypothetical protein HKN16_04715 [Saprospiraceae bacterium]|nr:hypothetical protein [Saprospiraceae bacterium]